MCCSSPPDPPDYSAQMQMSEETSKRALALQEQQFKWAQDESARNRSILERQLAISEPVMREQAEAGREARERYKDIYQPIEDYAAEEAMQYASPEEQAKRRAQAMSQVGQAFDAQRDVAQRRLESYGVDPSMTRQQALDVGIDIAEATAKAQAGEMAGNRVEDLGRSLRGEAINVGRGLPSQTAAAYGQALSAGQTGTGSALAQSQLAGQQMGTSPQYMQLGNQGLGTSASILGSSYNNQLNAWEAEQAASPWNAVGNLAGMAVKGYMGGLGGADGGMPPAAAFMDGGMADIHTNDPAIHFFDGGVVTDGYPTTAGVRTLSYADGGVTGGAIAGQGTTSANLRPLSYANGGTTPALGALTGSGGPGMGGVPGPQRTTAGLRRLADGTSGQTHAPGGDSSYQGSRANVRYPLGNSGGLITGLSDGTGIDDSIPAKVSAGEYVIPADVVHIKGREFFDKLLEKYHAPAEEQQAPETPPPNLGVPAIPGAANGGALPMQVPAHARYTQSALPPVSGGAGYLDGGAVYLTGGRGGNPDKRVHRPG